MLNHRLIAGNPSGFFDTRKGAVGEKIVEHKEVEMKTVAMNRTSAKWDLNPRRYARLLSERLPTVIRNEEENEEMFGGHLGIDEEGRA